MKKLALLFVLVACSKSNVKWSEINALRTESNSYTLNFADESLIVQALDGVGPFTFNATGPGSWIQSGNSFSYQRTWNKGTSTLTISDAVGFSTQVNIDLRPGILKLGGDNTSESISGSSSKCMNAQLNPSGNLVFSGYTTGVFNSSSLISPHGGSDAYIVKLKDSGAVDWIAQFGADNNTVTSISTQKMDDDGNIYAIGFTEGELYSHFPGLGSLTGSHGNQDLVIAKFNQSGALQWLRQIGGSGGYIESSGLKVLQDQNKDIYISGSTDIDFGATQIGVAGSYNVFALKISKDSGAVVWGYNFGGGLDSLGDPAQTNPIDFALDSLGNAFVYGDTTGDQVGSQVGVRGSRDVFLAKIDNSGSFQWSKQFGANDQLVGSSLFLSSSGKFLVTGFTSVDFESIFSEDYLQLKTKGSSDAFLLARKDLGNSTRSLFFIF